MKQNVSNITVTTAKFIAGVDEVGRGPLAGPVIAAAVILRAPLPGVKDSKQLSEKQREILAEQIQQEALAFAYGRAEVAEIDQINILQASLLAMRRAVLALTMIPDFVQVDGNRCPDLPMAVEAIIKGDQKIMAISAASILAKVARDREMMSYHEQYAGYGFDQHKGYPTQQHVQALEKLGPSPIHRRSFGPVKKLLPACKVNHIAFSS